MKKKWKGIPRFLILFLSLFLMMSYVAPVCAEEEEEEETEFIPEEYYDPIDTNEIKGWPQGEAVQSASAVVMDLNTSTLLYSKNAYEKRYPASITKIMTAMVALENGNPKDVITFDESVYDLEEGSSHVGIQPEEKMTLENALYALMLESANDAAVGIAEYLGGSQEGFADMMNQKAAELGCVNTHFVNPHGLHNEEHYTCAYDMALIAQAAYNIPEFRELVSCVQSSCPATNVTEEERYFVNHHKMLQEDSDYYTDWCTGGKTGYTSDAWNTLVTYGEKNGRKQVCVVLRVPGAAKCYEETRLLMNYGFDNFSQMNLVSDQPEPTFYEALKLNYVGLTKQYFQTGVLDETIGKTRSGLVTIPNGLPAADLTAQTSNMGQTGLNITYLYEEWPVGAALIELNTMPKDTALPFEQSLDMPTLLKNSSSLRARREIQQTAMTVYNRTIEISQDVYTSCRDFIERNKLMVLLGGGLILLVLLVIIIILIVRCTRESRIQRRRRQEEQERLKREEQIDQMTTAEIEQELREAMAQERQKREKEEAEEEARRLQEEKLRETERVLEEIDRIESEKKANKKKEK